MKGMLDLKILWMVPACALLFGGCSAPYYRKSADRQVYKIVDEKQAETLGLTNDFTIETRFSHRDPKEIPAGELVEERVQRLQRDLDVEEALRIAVENNRQYQFRKENLYLSGLTLTRERYEFRPQLFAGTTMAGERLPNGDRRVRANSRAGFDQFLRTGGSIGVNIANDLLRYYTGDPRRTAVSAISVNLFQPLLRGAGAAVAAEALTQAERDVVYEIRSFSHFQNTFAVDVVSAYLRLLQQQDTIRNEFMNYESVRILRERSEAMVEADRISQIQLGQSLQQEFTARNRYILAVERYQSSLDAFKITLGMPLGVQLRLDPQVLQEIRGLGLLPVNLNEIEGYEVAVATRLELLNEIDRFEDSKRRIHVAANRLKADLNIFADASLQSQPPTDYARFDINEWRGAAGVQLNLPLDRLRERNAYRSTLIQFERQLRTLTLALDDVRDRVRQGLRTLEQARQTYEIQLNSRALAERRVENAELQFEAGRIQTRDLLEAQTALLQSRNAATQALIDYHLARMRLLLEIGVLRTDLERFWVQDQPFSVQPEVPELLDEPVEVVPPEILLEDYL
jgi:outer membrane protein TolC